MQTRGALLHLPPSTHVPVDTRTPPCENTHGNNMAYLTGRGVGIYTPFPARIHTVYIWRVLQEALV